VKKNYSFVLSLASFDDVRRYRFVRAQNAIVRAAQSCALRKHRSTVFIKLSVGSVRLEEYVRAGRILKLCVLYVILSVL
jgi:hypothetical protein